MWLENRQAYHTYLHSLSSWPNANRCRECRYWWCWWWDGFDAHPERAGLGESEELGKLDSWKEERLYYVIMSKYLTNWSKKSCTVGQHQHEVTPKRGRLLVFPHLCPHKVQTQSWKGKRWNLEFDTMWFHDLICPINSLDMWECSKGFLNLHVRMSDMSIPATHVRDCQWSRQSFCCVAKCNEMKWLITMRVKKTRWCFKFVHFQQEARHGFLLRFVPRNTVHFSSECPSCCWLFRSSCVFVGWSSLKHIKASG